jgi:hypothetical protein
MKAVGSMDTAVLDYLTFGQLTLWAFFGCVKSLGKKEGFYSRCIKYDCHLMSCTFSNTLFIVLHDLWLHLQLHYSRKHMPHKQVKKL